MKKLLFACGLILANVANANTENTDSENAENKENRARMILEVYDFSVTPPKLVEGRTISRTNANHRLCWTAENIEPQTENLVLEQFISPVVIRFVDQFGTESQRDKSKTRHTFVSGLPTLQEKFVEKCWKFSAKYPKGTYSFFLRVNNTLFPEQKFQISN